MVDEIVYDYFKEEYRLIEEAEKDIKAAPRERFLVVLRGDDIYVECYESGNKRLGIAYSEIDVENGTVNRIRSFYAHKHDFPIGIARLIRMTIPAKKFDEIVKKLSEE